MRCRKTFQTSCLPWCVLSRFSHVWLFANLRAIACQAPLSMGFSRQEYWMDCHALLQGIFPTQGLNPSSKSTALAGGFLSLAPPGKPRLPAYKIFMFLIIVRSFSCFILNVIFFLASLSFLLELKHLLPITDFIFKQIILFYTYSIPIINS